MKKFRLNRYLTFRSSLSWYIISVNFIKIGWLEIKFWQIKISSKYYKELRSSIDFVLFVILLQCKDWFVWVIYLPTLYMQNFNINIISTECYKEISAIGKEMETFPATFDFSIVFKS